MSEPLLTDDRLADLAATGAASRWVGSGALTLHALDYGGRGPACILVPGITSPAVAWDFIARDLLDIVRPIVLDVRGRGLSSRARSYTAADYANDVEAIARSLDVSAVLLLGHSMGARIAAAVAARGNLRLLGSILVDPPMSGPGRGPYPTTLKSFQQQLAAARAGTTVEEVATFYPTWPARELELRVRWLATCDEAAVEATHAGFESEDFFEVWPKVPGRTALIYGADSPVVTAAGAAEAAETRPDATVVAVEQAGHMIPWDNRVGFLDVLRSLIATTLESDPSQGRGGGAH